MCTQKIEGFDNNVNKQHQIEQSLCSNIIYTNPFMLLFAQAINTKESWNQIYVVQNATYVRYDGNVNHAPPPHPTKKKKPR